jgi:hypothetical protein
LCVCRGGEGGWGVGVGWGGGGDWAGSAIVAFAAMVAVVVVVVALGPLHGLGKCDTQVADVFVRSCPPLSQSP